MEGQYNLRSPGKRMYDKVSYENVMWFFTIRIFAEAPLILFLSFML